MAESTNSTTLFPWTGQCACGHVCYSLHATPIVIHSCHCHQCQIETGSACAINLVIETSNLKSVFALSHPRLFPIKTISIIPSAIHRSHYINNNHAFEPIPHNNPQTRRRQHSPHPNALPKRQEPTHPPLPEMLRRSILSLRRIRTIQRIRAPRHARPEIREPP